MDDRIYVRIGFFGLMSCHSTCKLVSSNKLRESEWILSKEYEFAIAGHPNIYTGASRDLKIYFSEPENGVNEDTGLILFIPGYGGSSQSNVYKKMRREFADKYNLVTVQCDYFGSEFMQNEELRETPDNFNDQTLMQAIDNITAVLTVAAVIEDNELTFNAKKIILYGHSHGAYLSHLCNVYAPKLFSILIDNSAYMYPNYLYLDRVRRFTLTNTLSGAQRQVIINYTMSKHYVKDRELVDLQQLYKKFDNGCHILTYQGSADHMIVPAEKRAFCEAISHCDYKEIHENDVDGEVFKSTKHGDTDFLNLFEYSMKNKTFEKGNIIQTPNVEIKTKKGQYTFDYSKTIPIFKGLVR